MFFLSLLQIIVQYLNFIMLLQYYFTVVMNLQTMMTRMFRLSLIYKSFKIHLRYINNSTQNISAFRFSTIKNQHLNQSLQKILKLDSGLKQSNNQQKVIQVSKQQYLQMLDVLQKLNQEISQLQDNQKNKNNIINQSQLIQSSNSKNDQYFFSNQEQVISLKMMQITHKQQLFSWISKYSHQKQNQNRQSLQSKVKCQFVILCRFCMLGGAILSPIVNNLLLSVIKNVNLLSQNQVIQILSFLVQQIKRKESKQENSQNNECKIKLNELQNLIYFKNKSNKSSQLISLLLHLFPDKRVQIWKNFKLQFKLQQQGIITYNPLNIAHMICSFSQNKQLKSQKKYIQNIYISTFGKKKQYFSENSLKDKLLDLSNLSFQSVVYLLNNYQSLDRQDNFLIQLMLKIINNQIQFQSLFSLQQQLRIILAVLQRENFKSIFQQLKILNFATFQTDKLIKNIMLNQTNFQQQNNLLQKSEQKFQKINRILMILYQIWTQMYREQKNIKNIYKNNGLCEDFQIKRELIMQNICQAINKLLNLIQINEMVKILQSQDFQFKNKLTISISLFQVIVKTKIMINHLTKQKTQSIQKTDKLQNLLQQFNIKIQIFIFQFLKLIDRQDVNQIEFNKLHELQLNLYNSTKKFFTNPKIKSILKKCIGYPGLQNYEAKIKKFINFNNTD